MSTAPQSTAVPPHSTAEKGLLDFVGISVLLFSRRVADFPRVQVARKHPAALVVAGSDLGSPLHSVRGGAVERIFAVGGVGGVVVVGGGVVVVGVVVIVVHSVPIVCD